MTTPRHFGKLVSLCIVRLHIACSSHAPVRRMVVKHSGELAANSQHALSAPCSNAELQQYALMLAVGPVPEPACRPTRGQALLPKIRSQFLSIPTDSKGAAAPKIDGQQHTATNPHVYFAHLYVVQSTEKWCPHPCISPSWELAAPKPEPGSPYLLLEATIWRQSRKVTLYRFDAAWEKRARAASLEFCGGKSWGCAAYESFRESRSLLSVGPWPVEADTDPQVLSSFLRGAFMRVFDVVHRLAGADAHMGLTYSGHGGKADGSLFAGALRANDSAAVLGHATNGDMSSGKFSLLNFAGNCEEGRWNMLQALHPFADWILASDLEVGGLAHSGEASLVSAMVHLHDVAVLKRALEDRSSPWEAVKQVVEARQALWQGEERAGIVRQQLRQSLSGFRAASFPAFKEAVSMAFGTVPEQMRLVLTNYVEGASCDVLVALRILDASVSGSTGMQLLRRQDHIHKQHERGPLELQFLALRPIYTSTRLLFDWDVESNGLGFNTLHGKCDFGPAFAGSMPSSISEAL